MGGGNTGIKFCTKRLTRIQQLKSLIESIQELATRRHILIQNLRGTQHHTYRRHKIARRLIDLHNLPEINASLGHHVGDDALSEAARRLRQNVGPNDLVARLSAQQFLVVAAPCSLQRAPDCNAAAAKFDC